MNKKNDYTLEYLAKTILSHKYILAELLRDLLPEDFGKMSLKTIVDKYIQSSISNDDYFDLITEEIYTDYGKQNKYNLLFPITTPEGKQVIIDLDFKRLYSGEIVIYMILYMSDGLESDLALKIYEKYHHMMNAWINARPPREHQNCIILSQAVKYKMVVDGSDFNMIEIEANDYKTDLDLIKSIEVYVGGPEYENYYRVTKFIYDLFHNNQEEIADFFKNNEIEDFNIEEVFKLIEEFDTLFN